MMNKICLPKHINFSITEMDKVDINGDGKVNFAEVYATILKLN